MSVWSTLGGIQHIAVRHSRLVTYLSWKYASKKKSMQDFVSFAICIAWFMDTIHRSAITLKPPALYFVDHHQNSSAHQGMDTITPLKVSCGI